MRRICSLRKQETKRVETRIRWVGDLDLCESGNTNSKRRDRHAVQWKPNMCIARVPSSLLSSLSSSPSLMTVAPLRRTCLRSGNTYANVGGLNGFCSARKRSLNRHRVTIAGGTINFILEQLVKLTCDAFFPPRLRDNYVAFEAAERGDANPFGKCAKSALADTGEILTKVRVSRI